MSSQPFDYYKNKDVEYDYILQASVKTDIVGNTMSDIINLFSNEDLLQMYFPKVGLGRVYCKAEYLNKKLNITFGISGADNNEQFTVKDLTENIKSFIKSLNKNITQEPELKIKEGDIKVDILAENKEIIDNIDKKLVSENKLSFVRGLDTQVFNLTDDGIVEQYLNEKLQNSFPFSKLGIIRECKNAFQEGYVLREAEIETNNKDLNDVALENPEEAKQALQQNIEAVEEIQQLKDELVDKVDSLMEENKLEEDLKTDPFPSTKFTQRILLADEILNLNFIDELTIEQVAWLTTHFGSLAAFEKSFKQFASMVSFNDYIMSIDEYIMSLQEGGAL